jgi:hypothetical protein
MTPNGRGTGGHSTYLEHQHPGIVGANPHGPSASLHRRDLRVEAASAERGRSATMRARSWKSRAQIVIRRTHMYLGLLLLPFVGLYGATALLFNHASWLRPTTERALSGAVIAGSELVAMTSDPDAFARAIVPAGIEPRNARWEGSWSFESRAHGRVERFDVDPAGRGGRAFAWPEDARIASSLPAKFATSAAPGWRDPRALASALAPSLDLRAPDLTTRRAPRLAFDFEEGGRALLARWDPAKEAVQVVAATDHDPVDFLQTLHTAHGSPGFVDARWWWSWVVDALGVAMLAWSLSGLVLWWSIRAVRRAGLAVLALAAVLSLALFAGMHAAVPI